MLLSWHPNPVSHLRRKRHQSGEWGQAAGSGPYSWSQVVAVTMTLSTQALNATATHHHKSVTTCMTASDPGRPFSTTHSQRVLLTIRAQTHF